MQIMGLGVDLEGGLLFPPTEQAAFARQILAGWEKLPPSATSFRGEVRPLATVDGDPLVVGWTFLVHSADPDRDQIIDILQPLANRRGMENPRAPLLFNGEPEDDWMEWVEVNHRSRQLEGRTVPYYILIVGSPQWIPFKLQSFLDIFASVGRLDFETMEDLDSYIQKLIRIEDDSQPVTSREVLLFSTDHGLPDPTFFSRRYMVEPLRDYIEDRLKISTHLLAGDEATKTNFVTALRDRSPALVYSASHGLAALRRPVEDQMRYNGALCCQTPGHPRPREIFSADDVPLDRPFMEGAVFFQFACLGYGTPASSDFHHWVPDYPNQFSGREFVSAMPKRLLSHPRGPLAYVGHLDIALLHGFSDPKDPQGTGRWGARMSAFVGTVNKILGVKPYGMALQDINDRFNTANFAITNTYDRQRRGTFQWNEQNEMRLVDNWLVRTDAQNYMILGDPAVRLRLPDL